jgi:hypothetical protein
MKKLTEQQVFVLGEVEINLDPANLKFNEQTISEYYQKEGGNYDYYSSQLAYSDFLLSKRELIYDVVYNEKFAANKELGGSDKYVEAKTKSDEDVVEAKEDVILAKYKKNLLQQHIRSWDRNHDNALNLGHMLRKEMDKLGLELKGDKVSYEQEFKATILSPELDLNELK